MTDDPRARDATAAAVTMIAAALANDYQAGQRALEQSGVAPIDVLIASTVMAADLVETLAEATKRDKGDLLATLAMHWARQVDQGGLPPSWS